MLRISMSSPCVALGNAATFVFNLDQKALAFRMRTEDHGTAGSGVLEPIV
jgi:hypothetical protein